MTRRQLIRSPTCLLGFGLVAVVFSGSLRVASQSALLQLPFGVTPSSVWYLVTYEYGFVRRGLVGTGLLLVPFDWRVSTGWLLALLSTIVAVVGLVAVAFRLRQGTRQPQRRCLLLTILLGSPLYAVSLIADLGRLDSVCVALFCAAGLTLTSARFRKRGLSIVAGVGILATGVQEFAFLFFVPIAWMTTLTVRHRAASQWNHASSLAAILAPAAVVFAGSHLLKPSESLVSVVMSKGCCFGGPASTPGGSAWAVSQSLEGAVMFTMQSGGLGFALIVLGSVYVLTIAAVYVVVRPRQEMLFVAAYVSLVAITLSIVGIDGRRWWALAFITWVVILAVSVSQDRYENEKTQHPLGRKEWFVVGVSLVVCLASVGMPLTHDEFLPWVLELGPVGEMTSDL